MCMGGAPSPGPQRQPAKSPDANDAMARSQEMLKRRMGYASTMKVPGSEVPRTTAKTVLGA